ncbi:MAG TPA: hypothetical protein VGM56_29425 [Byssovorax sp.]|jgi:hypothetical protein
MSNEQELVARLLRAAAEDAPADGAKERALDSVASRAAEAVAARAAPPSIAEASPWLSHAIGGAATLALAAAVALVAYLPGGGASKHVAAASVAPSSAVDGPRAPQSKAGVVAQRVAHRAAPSVSSCAGAALPEAVATTCSSSGPPMLLEITNACSDETLDLYWVDFECNEVFYSQIEPGAVRYQSTFASHPWRVRDHATHRLVKEIARQQEGDATPPQPIEGEQPFVVEPGETAEESKRCSEAGLNARISLENKRPTPVEVYWVDYGCEEIFKGYVAPGETWHQNTWDAHLFRVRDAATHELVKELSADPAPAARRVAVSIP